MRRVTKQMPKKAKYILGILAVLSLGFMAKFAVGGMLKAEEPKDFLEVTSKTTKLKADSMVSSQDVTFTLKSSENRLIKIPDNEGYTVARSDGKAEFVINAPENFKEEEILKQIEAAPKVEVPENNGDETKQTEQQQEEAEKDLEEAYQKAIVGKTPEEIISSMSTLFYEKKEKTGTTYITLMANQPLKVIAHHTKPETKVSLEVTDVATSKKQTLFTFSGSNEEKKEEAQPEGESNPKPEVAYTPFRSAGDAYVEIASAEVNPNEVKDGKANFDLDDEPGHDSAEKNGIVRSFDTVTYQVKFSTRGTNSQDRLTNIKFAIEATYPKAVDMVGNQQVKFVDFSEGKMEGFPSDGSQTATFTHNGVLPTSSSQAVVPVVLKVYGAPNGYQIKPQIRVKLISGEDENGGNITLDTVSDDLVKNTVRVSSKVSFTAKIGTDQNLRTNYDSIAGTNTEDAYGQVFSVSLAITPLKDGSVRAGNDFRGVSYPKGTISGEIDSILTYTDEDNPTESKVLYPSDQEQAKVISYGFITSEDTTTENFTKTSQFSGVNIVPQSADYKSPDAVYSKGYERNSAIDSGKFNMANVGDRKISFSFENPAAYKYPTFFIDNGTPTDDLYFASGFGVMKFPYQYIKGKSAAIMGTFTLSSFTYTEGGETIKVPLKEKIMMSADNQPGGSIMIYSPWNDAKGGVLGTSDSNYIPSGNGRILVGSDVTVPVQVIADSLEAKYVEAITVWNGGSVELAKSPENENGKGDRPQFDIEEGQYGVLKDGGVFPGLNTDFDVKKDRFDWYDTLSEARKHGTVTGYYTKLLKSPVDKRAVFLNNFSFHSVTGLIGDKDKNGNSNIVYTIGRFLDKDDKVTLTYPTEEMGSFRPTLYNTSAGYIITPQQPQGSYGDTLYYTGMFTRITRFGIDTGRDETVDPSKRQLWFLEVNTAVGNKDNYKIAITITLPTGTVYQKGTATNGYGGAQYAPLGEPEVESRNDGSSVLRWNLIYNKSYTPFNKIFFETFIDPRTFPEGYTQVNYNAYVTVEGKSIDNPDIVDTGRDEYRNRSHAFIVKRPNVVGIDSLRREPYIEIGNNDPSIQGKTDEDGEPIRLNDIHYNLKAMNWTTSSLTDVRMLDVLPYSGDGRTSNYNVKKYHLLNAQLDVPTTGTTKIYYTTSDKYTPKTDPNTVDLTDGWVEYRNNSKVDISDVKAIMVVADKMNAMDLLSVNIHVLPVGLSSGDAFRNNIIFNSSLNMTTDTVYDTTLVVARTFKGTVWYDDNLNGLKEEDEAKVGDVPIRIFRKSIEQNETTYKLLEKDLKGSDITGLKTGSDGNYQISNLPEGNYKIEFQVGDEVRTTLKDVTPSSTLENTSKVGKVSQDYYASTDNYVQMTLSQVKGAYVLVPNINAGLIRKGDIEIYKYIKGMISDVNGDYKPDDPRELNSDGTLINKSAALSGATFELREIKRNPLTNKEISNKKVDEDTTDNEGKLIFHVFPHVDEKDENGDVIAKFSYQLVELKSPSGYVPLDKPIDNLISTAGTPSRYYVPNSPENKLPYTGSNDIMQGTLIVAGFLFLIALGFVGVQLFRLDDGWQGR